MEAVMSCLGLGGGQKESCKQRLFEREHPLPENAIECLESQSEKGGTPRDITVLVTGMGVRAEILSKGLQFFSIVWITNP
jgi:hypothetical protein